MIKYQDPHIWGGSCWILLHCIALTYPKRATIAEKSHYANFLMALAPVLPCPKCRQSYLDYIINHPPHLQSRRAFVRWTIDLHNEVNQRLQKPILPYKDALSHIQRQCRTLQTAENQQPHDLKKSKGRKKQHE